MRGKRWMDLGYEQWHADLHDRELDQVIATRAPIRSEIPFTGTNGRPTYDCIFAPVLGADGQGAAVAGTARDITERQRMALRMLESQRLQAIGRLAAGVAHDFNHMLAATHDFSGPASGVAGSRTGEGNHARDPRAREKAAVVISVGGASAAEDLPERIGRRRSTGGWTSSYPDATLPTLTSITLRRGSRGHLPVGSTSTSTASLGSVASVR